MICKWNRKKVNILYQYTCTTAKVFLSVAVSVLIYIGYVMYRTTCIVIRIVSDDRRIVPALKFSDTRNFCCNLPKIQTKRQNFGIFRQKDANGIGNSEDPDLGLHCLPRPICPKT